MIPTTLGSIFLLFPPDKRTLPTVLVGLAIPLAASLKASTNVIEIGLWGAVTVVVQLLVFRLVDLLLANLQTFRTVRAQYPDGTR